MGRFLTSALVSLAIGLCAQAQAIPPPSGGVEIHPSANPSKCVEVRGGVFANGTPVQIYDCNGTAAQKWEFTRNQIQALIRLAGTNFCLDAGSNPYQPNGNQMKIWECYPNLTQQHWYINANDNTIKLSDIRYGRFGICLDLTEGRLDNTNVLQTWECTENNANQLWNSGPTTTVIPTTGPITPTPPTPTEAYPKPGCPVYSCAACPPSYTHTFIAPEPTLCHACACASTPAASPTVAFPTPGGEYPRPGCPVYSCPACPPGSNPTFVAPNPNVCHACACISPAATPRPTTTPAPVPTPVNETGGDYPRPGCPLFTCAACPSGLIQTITAPNETACHTCACAFPTPTINGSPVDSVPATITPA